MMATYVQRAQAIGNALVNGTATPAQIDRLGRALANGAARLAEYDAATNAQKAGFLVAEVRRHILGVIKQFEAEDAVRAATTVANTTTDADFSETP